MTLQRLNKSFIELRNGATHLQSSKPIEINLAQLSYLSSQTINWHDPKPHRNHANKP